MLEQLEWRYAVKKMDPSKPVSEDNLDEILRAIRFAPTSSGMQPFKVFVVTNPSLREQMLPIANSQSQILDASHLLVFTAFANYAEEQFDSVLDLHVSERPGTREMLGGYYSGLKKFLLSREAQTNFEHAARQAYITLGFAMAAAAELQVDSTPMEGFDPDALDELMGLAEQGLKSVCILALGGRADEGDWLQPMKKVRKPNAELFERLD